MKNLEFSLDRELDFMIKYNLTADELFVIKLIFYAQEDHEEYLSKYFSNCREINLREVLKRLQEKEIINKTYKIPESGKEFNPRDVDFNKIVVKQYLIHSNTLGMELFEAYPPYTNINSKTFSLRNITKLYKDLDEMGFAYGKLIQFNPEKHKQVMELLEWGKENNKIQSGICDFIASCKWLDLKAMIDGGETDWNTSVLI